MRIDVAMDSVEEKEANGLAHAPEKKPLDGDFPIEGDGGAVDNSSKTQIPPPPPPAY